MHFLSIFAWTHHKNRSTQFYYNRLHLLNYSNFFWVFRNWTPGQKVFFITIYNRNNYSNDCLEVKRQLHFSFRIKFSSKKIILEMFLVILTLFIFLSIFETVNLNNVGTKTNLTPTNIISSYTSSLITQQNAKDPSRYHDVTMFRLERTPGSEVYKEILSVVLKKNQGNSVYSQTSLAPIPPFHHFTSLLPT